MAELDRVLGGSGHDAGSRLGLAPDATPQDVRTAALESLDRWQRLAEHPLSDRAVQTAARTARRALEGIVAEASARPDRADSVSTLSADAGARAKIQISPRGPRTRRRASGCGAAAGW